MQTGFLSDKQIFKSASLEHHLMTVQALLSQQNISTVRWQLANSFCSSAYHTPLTVYPVSTKPTKTSISAGALSPVNIVTRRVETDNHVLLQVRDESSFHGLMLLAIQFKLIRNVLEFLFQNFKDSIGTCFEILHFVVSKALWASDYKTFRLLKVGHVCMVLQRLQRTFSSVLLVVGNINHRRC